MSLLYCIIWTVSATLAAFIQEVSKSGRCSISHQGFPRHNICIWTGTLLFIAATFLQRGVSVWSKAGLRRCVGWDTHLENMSWAVVSLPAGKADSEMMEGNFIWIVQTCIMCCTSSKKENLMQAEICLRAILVLCATCRPCCPAFFSYCDLFLYWLIELLRATLKTKLLLFALLIKGTANIRDMISNDFLAVPMVRAYNDGQLLQCIHGSQHREGVIFKKI